MAVLFLLMAFVAAAVLFWFRGPHSRFRAGGVKYLTPVPLLGDMGRVIFRIQHVLDNMDRIYKAFPGERFVGICELIHPVVVIRDPELVKRITIQDFDHFHDHGVVVDESIDQVFGKNLFALKGQHWKDMRTRVTPMFSSSKLRVMFPFMMDAGNNAVSRIQRNMKESGKNYVDMDIKDVTSRFANDVLASSIYGLKLDSHSQNNTDFFEMAKLMSELKYPQLLKFMGYQVAPSVMKITNTTMFSKRASQFFAELLRKTLKSRKAHNIHRPDLIEMFLQYHKDAALGDDEDKTSATTASDDAKTKNVGPKTAVPWSVSDLLGQIVAFLVAGFDVTASAMAFLTHMLALHPEVQEKLVQEIKEFDEKNGGKLDYDSILQMNYLDMAISELLRMWAASISERVCVKDYNLGRPNDKATKDYIVRKGDTVRMFLRSIHHDPEYYPEPHKFNPERFSKENRSKIRPGTYSPFGAGPRVCIGTRFAQIEIKVMTVKLLQHMEVLPCEKTRTNIELSTSSLIPLARGGHWVRLQPRQLAK